MEVLPVVSDLSSYGGWDLIVLGDHLDFHMPRSIPICYPNLWISVFRPGRGGTRIFVYLLMSGSAQGTDPTSPAGCSAAHSSAPRFLPQ